MEGVATEKIYLNHFSWHLIIKIFRTTTIDSRDVMYKQLYKPNHHRADITGMVPVHILEAEKQLGRPLVKGEIVHHKDFDKLNNDPDNLLFPITRPEHQKLPEYQSRFILSKGLYEEFLVWWRSMQKHDELNSRIKEVERKLVRAQNERERLKKHASSK